MHVIQFVAASGPGGIEQVAFDYACAMRQVGVQCTTVASLPDREISKYNEESLDVIKDQSLARWYNLLHFYRYNKIISQKNTVATIVHVGRAQTLARFSSLKIPVISVAHTYNLKRRLRADAIICVNSSITRKAINILAEKKKYKPSFTIHNPISIQNSQKLWSNIKYKNDVIKKRSPLIIGAMGQHIKHKGFDYFLRSLKILKEKQIQFKCVLGGDGQERKNLEELSEQLGLNEIVDFRGWINNKVAFYEGIDLFCLPSLSEPFGLVMTEAMSLGKPVVATNTDGPLEIIRPNIDGLIVPRGDVVALADAFEFLATRRDILVEMGISARSHVLEQFSYERIGNMLRKAIIEISRQYSGHTTSSSCSFAGKTLSTRYGTEKHGAD